MDIFALWVKTQKASTNYSLYPLKQEKEKKGQILLVFMPKSLSILFTWGWGV